MKVQNKNLSPKPSRPNITALTKKVVDLIREDDKAIGYLNQYHVKWLLMFTYEYFKVKKAGISFDFNSAPKRIVITPFNLVNGQLVKFSRLAWIGYWLRLKWERIERDLPGFIELYEFTINFSRVPPESTNVMEPKNDTTGEKSTS